MPLELATRLILRAADGSPLPATRVREIAASWAEVPLAAVDVIDEVVGRAGGRVTTREAWVGDTRCRWDLSLKRADDDDDSVAWIAQLTGIFEPDRTTLVVRLRRNSDDPRLRPLGGAPLPPRVIRDVLGASNVDSFDGPIRMQSRYRELAADEVDGFVTLQLLAIDRRLPVIAVAKSSVPPQERLDVKRLTRDLAGFAHIVVVDRAALPVLGKRLENLSLAPGSARVWWPALGLDDEPAGHPHWAAPFNDPSAVITRIRQQVLSASRDRWREPDRVSGFDHDLRRARDAAGRVAASRVVDEVARLRAAAAADRERAEQAPQSVPVPVIDIEAYEKQLAEMAEDVTTVNSELDRQRELAEMAASLLEESEVERDRAEQARRALHGQLEGLRAQFKERSRTEEAPAPTPEEMFAAEVEDSWNARLTADDRVAHPLLAFAIREEFVASVAACGADRQKVVDTVMEAACGRAKEIEGRKLHRLRTGSSGNAPERKRKSDGAVAWRCNVQTGAASARRLHFWACPRGTLEFACVVVHDDFSIPD